MSKKRKQFNLPRVEASASTMPNSFSDNLNEEYMVIKSELIRLLILNAVIFALIIVLYYYDQQTDFLRTVYSSIFR